MGFFFVDFRQNCITLYSDEGARLSAFMKRLTAVFQSLIVFVPEQNARTKLFSLKFNDPEPHLGQSIQELFK